jgi:hypothetical protein
MVDVNTLERPPYGGKSSGIVMSSRYEKLLTPVPDSMNGRIGVVHGDIADSELLVTNRHTIHATVEYDV